MHYRLVDKIGEGGMGVVWKAIDTRLDREVAIKILPDEFSQDPQRLARFKEEARALAALNHPSIVTIYSVEQNEELHFITMELVSGQALSAMIEPAGCPLARFLEVGIPLVEAVAAAHQKGVVHRDRPPRLSAPLQPGLPLLVGRGDRRVTRLPGTLDQCRVQCEEWIERDSDLDSIRRHPRYRELLDKLD